MLPHHICHSSWCYPNRKTDYVLKIPRRREQRQFAATSPKIYCCWSKQDSEFFILKGNLENIFLCLAFCLSRGSQEIKQGHNTQNYLSSMLRRTDSVPTTWIHVSWRLHEAVSKWYVWEWQKSMLFNTTFSFHTVLHQALLHYFPTPLINASDILTWDSYISTKILQQKIGRVRLNNCVKEKKKKSKREDKRVSVTSCNQRILPLCLWSLMTDHYHGLLPEGGSSEQSYNHSEVRTILPAQIKKKNALSYL